MSVCVCLCVFACVFKCAFTIACACSERVRIRACVCTVYAEVKKELLSTSFRGLVCMCVQNPRHDLQCDDERHDHQMASPSGSVVRRHSRPRTRAVGNNNASVASSFPSLNS